MAINISCDDYDDIILVKSIFAFSVCNNVLMNVSLLEFFLTEVYQHLKNGGEYYIWYLQMILKFEIFKLEKNLRKELNCISCIKKKN